MKTSFVSVIGESAALALILAVGCLLALQSTHAADAPSTGRPGGFKFDTTISREVLDNYLSRSVSMEGLLNGRGDLDDNIRMLRHTGAKFIGRSICLWGGETNFLKNLERARQRAPKVHQ